MNPVFWLDAVTSIVFLATVALVISRSRVFIKNDTYWILLFLLSIRLINGVSNLLTWSGTSVLLESVEDFPGLLEPVFWGFLFYSILQQSIRKRLTKGDASFRLLTESASDVLWTSTLNGRMTYVSRSVEQHLGYKAEEALEMGLNGMLTPESSKLAEETLGHELSRDSVPGVDPNRSIIVELEEIAKNGESVWSEVRVTFIRNADGIPIGLMGVTRDITERRKTLEALRESEEKFARAFKFAPLHMLISNPADGRLIEVNDCFVEKTGFTREEAIGKTSIELNLITKEVREHLTSELRTHGRIRNMEVPIRFKSGEEILGRLYAEIITIGGVERLLIITDDTTERRRALSALKASEKRYQAVFEASNDGILMFRDRKIVECNSKALEMFGRSLEEMIAIEPVELSPQFQPDGRESSSAMEEKTQLILTGEPQAFEWQHVRSDGQVFDTEVLASRLDLEGSVFALVVIRDISDRKRVEEDQARLESQFRQTQKLEAIGVLAGGIAHDFNNVLFGILGYSDLALEELDPDSEAAEYVREITIAGHRGADLVKQILTFARRTERKLEQIELVPLIKEVGKMMQSVLPATIAVRFNDLPDKAVIEADETEIHQVLMNLCTNAGHAMMESGGTLIITLRDLEVDENSTGVSPGLMPGSYYLLSVDDTGPGIPEEIIERIFVPFFTTKERGEGTGMGLSVVHGIVTELGGHISVYSEPGQGARFNVYLPRSVKQREIEALEESDLPRGSESICVVDDEPSLTAMLRIMLENLGYKITTFNDSAEALEAIKADPESFDVLVTDYTMPGMTGKELAVEVLKARPDIPVILCTGFSKTLNRDQAIELGIADFIIKPLTTKELAHTIRNVLDGS